MPSITGPLPDNILKRMSKADRPKGVAGMTAEELSAREIAKAERELQNQIMSLLDRLGIWYAWQRMDRKTTGKPGTPDFLFNIKGHGAVAWECKKYGVNKLSEKQEDVRTKMERDGWDYYLLDTYGQALALLQKMNVIME